RDIRCPESGFRDTAAEAERVGASGVLLGRSPVPNVALETLSVPNATLGTSHPSTALANLWSCLESRIWLFDMDHKAVIVKAWTTNEEA
ncbi:hypothetical protein, partial [Amycolatopsis lurida]|uniref:hypothetical protein n=1 Tax=Amycolatopsis lurida TaxID=31959 RepID=UPI003659A896